MKYLFLGEYEVFNWSCSCTIPKTIGLRYTKISWKQLERYHFEGMKHRK